MVKKYNSSKNKTQGKKIKNHIENEATASEKAAPQEIKPKDSLFKNSFLSETAKYFFISLLIFIAILIFSSLFLTPKASDKFELKEAPLTKIKQLNLVPGEVYVYEYKINNSINRLTHKIMAGPGCTFIEIKETVNTTGICVDKYGNDKVNSNATFDIPYISLFKPWMLAVKDNWIWNVRAVLNTGSFEIEMLELRYTTLKQERIFGRDAYVVKIESVKDPSQNSLLWVDDEKRILLKEIGQGYEIILETAPFILETENSSINQTKALP